MKVFVAFIGSLSCVLLATVGVYGQVKVGPFPPGQGRGAGGPATPAPWAEMGMIAIEPLEIALPVTGVPYSAEAVTQTTQVLADGNRIERRTTAVIARDSRGRVRREQQAMPLGALVVGSPFIVISDPAARTHITLDRDRRTAIRVTTPPPDTSTRRNSPPEGPTSKAPGGATTTTESLGTRDVDGVRAEGTRTTVTIPALAIGNQAPMVTVSERWYSQDLRAVVMTERSDPRFGKTVYRLVNVVRAEPRAELFEIPAGYTIEEQALPRPLPRKQ